MKTRSISALIVLAVFIPIFILGGTVFKIAVFALAILALKEFIDIKTTKGDIPLFVKVISFIFLILIILVNIKGEVITLQMDYRVISALFLSFLIPNVLYHNRDKYSINDAFYLIGGVFFLALSMSLLISVRNESLGLITYLFLITVMTDTFAYITGSLIGKHKLLTEISPKKTWEGTIGGTIMGVFVGTIFYITVINPAVQLSTIIYVSTFLSVLAQFGDLVFSSIKRYFGQKDFSNIMPGHGGVLDRLDSIIFVLLGFMFFITIL